MEIMYKGYIITLRTEPTNGYPETAYIAESEAVDKLGGAYVAGFSDVDHQAAIEKVQNALDVILSG